ncbi:MAG TPA: VOC family protein [Burkholderiales bacterium]|nr:VOC family protein [Burkholderiales bacterium]
MRAFEKQWPPRGKINLDHVGHFVPNMDAASTALTRLGFTVTPFSAHSHRLDPGAPLLPAGTGNRCVMLKTGYLEIVTPTGDTPMADQLRLAIGRYVGIHLIAFGTAAPELDHARLAAAGYAPLVPVALQRAIEVDSGTDTVRFTVVRVPPGVMPEGRIQFCRQDTPHLLWQERWLDHPNRAIALTGVLLCVDEPRTAAERYGRFCGIEPEKTSSGWLIQTSRGSLVLFDAETCRRTFGIVPPAMPWIAGYILATDDMNAAREHCVAAGVDPRNFVNDRLLVPMPAAVGGLLIFERPESGPLELTSA